MKTWRPILIRKDGEIAMLEMSVMTQEGLMLVLEMFVEWQLERKSGEQELAIEFCQVARG
jgi:hypothetical protein